MFPREFRNATSTLTSVAEWEQKTALKYAQTYMVARRY